MKTRIGLIVTIMTMTASCGGDAACAPGEQVECACAGGVTGAQTCNAEGTAFEQCSCDGNPNPSGGGAAQPGNPCEQFAAVAKAKAEQCDLQLEGGAPAGGAAPCTAEAQAAAQCLTPCVEGLSCAALNGDDEEGLTAYADCITPCTE